MITYTVLYMYIIHIYVYIYYSIYYIQVGLSGSSAIITATLRALLTYYNITLEEDLNIRKADLPDFILNIEKKELGIAHDYKYIHEYIHVMCVYLGIAAGLQDRVIQTYGGVVYMDFSSPNVSTPSLYKDPAYIQLHHLVVEESVNHHKYIPLNPILMPVLYLAYNLSAGAYYKYIRVYFNYNVVFLYIAGESGKVHSTVRGRWDNKDPELIQGMNELASIADKGQFIVFLNSIYIVNHLCAYVTLTYIQEWMH